MRKTKFVRLCLTLFICLALSLTISVGAEAAGTTFHVNNQKGKSGDTVTVPISVNTSEGLGGVQAELYYDKDVLSFSKMKKSGLLKEANGLFDYNHIEDESKITFVFVTLDELSGKGDVVDVTFKLKKDCKKELPIAVKLTSVVDASDEGKEISASVTGTSKDYENKVFGGGAGQSQEGSDNNSNEGSENSGAKTDTQKPADGQDGNATTSDNNGDGDKNSTAGDGSGEDASGDVSDEPNGDGADDENDGSEDMNFGDSTDSSAEKEKEGGSAGLIIAIVAVVVIIAGAAGFFVMKKKDKE